MITPPSYMCKKPKKGAKRGGIANGNYDASLDDIEEAEPHEYGKPKRGRPKGRVTQGGS